MTTSPPFILTALASLNDAGVSWCLLRGESDLSEPTGDVDLLVAHEHLDRASATLRSAGFVHQRTWAGGTQRFFLGLDPSTGRFVLLHVTSVVSFGRWYEFTLAVADDCLRRSRRTGGGLTVADAADEFWISLLHCLLDKGAITPKHRSRLPQLAAFAGIDDGVAAAVPERGAGGWDPPTLLSDVRAGRWDAVEAAAPAIRRCWRQQVPSVRVRAAVNAASLWRRKLSEPVVARGTSCGLLAPDGAGKSTVAETLTHMFPRPARVIYLGAYGAGTEGTRLPIPGLDTIIRSARMWTRWTIGCWHQSRRRFVIYDRHPIELRFGVPTGARLGLRRRFLAALPRPDLLIVLDAPGDVLHKRKVEHDVASLERMRQRYLELAERTPGTVVIDADRPLERVCRDAAAAIWAKRTKPG